MQRKSKLIYLLSFTSRARTWRPWISGRMFLNVDRRESLEELGSDLEEEIWGRVYISPDGTFRRRQGYRATRSPEDSDLIRSQTSDVSEIPPLSIRRHRSGNSRRSSA